MKIEFNNLYIHFIMTTLNRYPCIEENNRVRIEKYITGIINNTGSRLYAIYINPEHTHLLVSKSPKISEEDFIGLIALNSAKFINDNKLVLGSFKWQNSASAFSVSKSNVKKVCRYIINQPIHHSKASFKEEYDLLIKFYNQNLTEKK